MEIWKAQRINLFGPCASDYTPDQVSLINITKEYTSAFKYIGQHVCGKCGQKKQCKERCNQWPSLAVQEDYIRFREWLRKFDPEKQRTSYKGGGWV